MWDLVRVWLQALGFQQVRCKVPAGFSVLRANEGLDWVAVKKFNLSYHHMNHMGI